MIDAEREVVLQRAFAKIGLLEQLVRLLLRERASIHGQTPEDILTWAEEQKQFFEGNMSKGSEIYVTGAVDAFFNLLASEVRADRQDP